MKNMKKLAIAAMVIISAGVTFSLATGLETLKASSDIGDIRIPDLQKDGFDTAVNGALPVPQQQPPGHWHPQPDPGAAQTLIFKSGEFVFIGDAEKSMEESVRQLNAAGCAVMESRITWPKYTLVFMAPARAQIQNYTSGQYTFNSEAEAALRGAVEALKRSGKVILEARLNWTVFTISYLDGRPGGQQDWTGPQLTFQSGEFPFSGDAGRAMEESVRQLNAAGCAVMESRLNWTKYTLVFITPARMQIRNYTSGQYNFNGEAEAAMKGAVAALKQSGKVILEARLNWTVFTISYLEAGYHPFPREKRQGL